MRDASGVKCRERLDISQCTSEVPARRISVGKPAFCNEPRRKLDRDCPVREPRPIDRSAREVRMGLVKCWECSRSGAQWEEIMSDRSATPPAVSALAAGVIAVVALLAVPAQVHSADEIEVTITIKDHKFDPVEVRVPAGQAIKLTVKNLDASAEEFESKTLKVEKV